MSIITSARASYTRLQTDLTSLILGQLIEGLFFPPRFISARCPGYPKTQFPLVFLHLTFWPCVVRLFVALHKLVDPAAVASETCCDADINLSRATYSSSCTLHHGCPFIISHHLPYRCCSCKSYLVCCNRLCAYPSTRYRSDL